MKTSQSSIANTLVDRRGIALSKENLEVLVAQIKESYIPVNIEHDPRIPVQGRISDAFLNEMKDGEYEVIAEIQFFDETDSIESTKGSKEIVSRQKTNDTVIIGYDRNFNNPIDLKEIKEIENSLNGKSTLAIKNSVDPIAVLEITVLVSFGYISKGFLSKIGGDAYEVTKNKIKKIFSRKKEEEKEKILSLSFVVVKGDIKFDVEVLATNPSKEEIDSLFAEGLEELDKIVPSLYQDDIRLKKMVFEYKKEKMEIKYAVTKDCFPLILGTDEKHMDT